jgi:diguanylate cyclase (GGDEF)-like protein
MLAGLKWPLRSLAFGACAVVLLGLFTPNCPAQRYTFRNYTTGLNNLNVNSIEQDRAGYLWLGTENGLFRYDGSQFREFGTDEGLRARIIQRLFLGPDGTLWVGTTTGIYFLRQDGNFAEVRPPGAPDRQFSMRLGAVFAAIASDRIVAADRSGAYLLRHTGREQWTAEPMHLDGGTVWSVLATPGGVLWYGCGQDLCRMAGGKTTRMAALLHLPAEEWIHLLSDRDGHIWVRGMSHLGEVLPAEHRYRDHALPGLERGVPYAALALDMHGHVAAIGGAGFGLWENGRWRMVTQRNGLSQSYLSTLFVDREGTIWIGVVGHGLIHWAGQDQWEGYTDSNGLTDDIVWASMRDSTGRMWFGTESGLDWMGAGEQTAHLWRSPGISTVRAFALAEGARGAIWMGSESGSLVQIDPKTLAGKQWKLPEIHRVLCDNQKRLWVATYSGLYRVDTASGDLTPRLVEDPAIADPRQVYFDLTLDPENRLWAVTNQGLLRLDDSGWHRIQADFSAGIPNLLVADRQGSIWIAGEFSGLQRLRIKGDQVVDSKYFTKPSLLSDQAVALFVDHRGWLWVSQDVGLSVFDGQTWRSFTQDEGLIWNDGDGDGLYEDRDGSMWIGTSGGVSHLLKPLAVADTPPASLIFSEFVYGSTPVAPGDRFQWKSAPLSIALGSLSFRDERSIRVRYRLVGLQSEWAETEDKRIHFTPLVPGDYRFEAQAIDAYSGAASPVEAMSFTITPKWWQSAWLKLAAVFLLALGLVLAWRWSIQLLVWQKRQLEEAVKHRTEDLEREKAELLRTREQMRHFAEHDGLTHLWNHRVIMDRLRQEVDRARRNNEPLSLILVDLDNFKKVNDTHGHMTGDLVLKEVADIFAHSVRSYDWVGRYGGEEFLLILPATDSLSARIRAEQLRQAVESTPMCEGNVAICITASFGVSSGIPLNCDSLIKAADKALYRAKDSGRNRVEATELDSTAPTPQA